MPDDDRTAPRLSDPTEVDATDPFDSTGSGSPRQTQLSDPPTVLVRRESFREPSCPIHRLCSCAERASASCHPDQSARWLTGARTS